MNYVSHMNELFDQLDSMLSQGTMMRPAKLNSFPFFNIVKEKADQYVLEVAVAGFADDEIDVEVTGRTLKITGNAKEDERDYVYKGISTKSFVKTYSLARNVEVAGGEIKDGLLKVHFNVIVPEENATRKIELKSTAQLLEE